MRHRVRLTLGLVTAFAAFAALTGCAQPPGAALLVGGEVVLTVDEAEQAAATTALLAPQFGATTLDAQTIMTLFAEGAAADFLAPLIEEALGVAVDLSEAALITEDGLNDWGNALYSDPATKGLVPALLKWSVIKQYIDEETAVQLLQGFDVEVNPVYGRWVPEAFAVAGAGNNLSAQLTAS
jgi:hypothetical protein